MSVKVTSASELKSLRERLEALSTAKNVVNDSRVSASLEDKFVATAPEVRAKQIAAEHQKPTIQAIKKNTQLTDIITLQDRFNNLVAELQSFPSGQTKSKRTEAVDKAMNERNDIYKLAKLVAKARDMNITEVVPPELDTELHQQIKRIDPRIASRPTPVVPRMPTTPVPTFPDTIRNRWKQRDSPGPAETTGSGITKADRFTTGFKINRDGMFGGLHIDMEALGQMTLKAMDDSGKVVLSRKIDPTMLDLITKRYNSKLMYSASAIATFRELVEKSNHPVRGSHSAKAKLLFDNQKGGCLPADITHDQAITRMKVIVGEMEAGNNAPQLKSELNDLAFYLHKEGKLNKREAMAIYRDYIA